MGRKKEGMPERIKLHSVKLGAAVIAAAAVFSMAGCGIRESSAEKIRDMEFTVLPDAEVPMEYLDFIGENKEMPMKLTYCSEDALYIAVGYGEQETGGYSISVDDFYLTENGICIDTTLHGPSVSEAAAEGKSYPYIVVKTEKMDVPVLFE